ncbi:3'(2'),5'-bisphosphate nucleotidase CysQ [Candidatus Thioglobus autotrophicus]|uniref:3'(2'),5'-bisphosphate nucleotidase CysQ n=1 Tax=Candidatus Thioglobus autotrophicus TaxID=1705394 RepID=UPI00299D2260|nr:3'(2'),5'-bisphosphate nucleotidase CysQ [Candidatus Thioglobus autotrophicus]WPE18184.1 3'(2'),5'-bisphosphate nucleotidase CysQ [Candidatus Thioglobus autotrophicus]
MLNQIDVQDIVAIAKEAGDAIIQIYKQDFKVEYKQDSSPLTLADKNANDIIEDGLSQLSVNFPVLSEEGDDIPYEDRKHWEYFWLVDPLDGTKEFVKRNDEFTVNIALIHKDTPVLGVVYAPALDMCYWAKQGEGAFKDGQRLPIKTVNQRNTYKIVASRSHMSDETQAFIDAIDTSKKKELISIGSSLKICLVAEGEADIYPRLAPTMEWDTSAAHAIISESSGKLIDQISRKSLKYNSKKELLNNNFIVTN